jgi:tRNA1(Val) A37 N6-methylase TrmN6
MFKEHIMALTLDYLPNHKDIQLYQDKEMICINTDTMILGEYLKLKNDATLLDVGTNNGALLLYAKRFSPKKYIGIDINNEALAIAKKNLELNNIFNYQLINIDAKDYIGEQVDVIVCNPPYFKMTQDSINSKKNMVLAKHEDSLILDDLIKMLSRNLKDHGKLFLLYQSSRLQELMNCLSLYKFRVKEMKFVYHINKDNSNVVLIKATKSGSLGLEVKKPIIIKDMKVM